MFGGKREKLNEKLLENQEEEVEEVYKFYDYENKPQEKIEIQAILNSNSAYKVIVILDGRSTTIEYLCVKIAEHMEKFQEFENLEGLKAVNLTKKTDKGTLKIPITGEINEFISDGDIIFCDLNTEEYWVKTTIKMNSGSNNLLINLDIKFRMDALIKKLRFLLMKLGINFWIDTASQLEDTNHYFFTSLNFKTLKSKSDVDYSVSDLQKGLSIEKKKVSDLLDFHSEIQFSVYLSSLEELYFNKLRDVNPLKKPGNKLKWDEFRGLSYQMFSSNPKFIAEKQLCSIFIKRLIIEDQRSQEASFYLYNRNYLVKSHKIIEDEDLDKEKGEELLNLIILPYNNKNKSQESLNRISILEPGSIRKISSEADLSHGNELPKNNIVIHKSDMKFYSSKAFGIKTQKESICSVDAQNPNYVDIGVANNGNNKNDDLVSEYTYQESSSSSLGDTDKNNRIRKSFHKNAKMMNEFNLNFEEEQSSQNNNENNDCKRNETTTIKNIQGKNDVEIKDKRVKISSKSSKIFEVKVKDKFNRLNQEFKEENDFKLDTDLNKNQIFTVGNSNKDSYNKNIEDADAADTLASTERDNFINTGCKNALLIDSNSEIKLKIISEGTIQKASKPEIQEKLRDSLINNLTDLEEEQEANFYFTENSSMKKNLYKSCPIKEPKYNNNPVIQDEEGKEKNEFLDRSQQSPKHLKHTSLGDLDLKKTFFLNSTKVVEEEEEEDERELKCQYIDNLNDYAGNDESRMKKAKFSPKHTHKTSVNLKNNAKENREKNLIDSNNFKTHNPNDNRKVSFFNNYRNQANLVKDLKSALKEEDLKKEIEKFSDLKISKHILERIKMPPFRNVQIELKTTDESINNEMLQKELDEPLRINHIQILSFLILLLLLFTIAILVIFLSN